VHTGNVESGNNSPDNLPNVDDVGRQSIAASIAKRQVGAFTDIGVSLRKKQVRASIIAARGMLEVVLTTPMEAMALLEGSEEMWQFRCLRSKLGQRYDLVEMCYTFDVALRWRWLLALSMDGWAMADHYCCIAKTAFDIYYLRSIACHS